MHVLSSVVCAQAENKLFLSDQLGTGPSWLACIMYFNELYRIYLNVTAYMCLSDQHILQAVSSYKIEFSVYPEQTLRPEMLKFNELETEAMGKIIIALEERGIIEKCALEVGDFLNTVFLGEESTSVPDYRKFRMILNAKELHNYV